MVFSSLAPATAAPGINIYNHLSLIVDDKWNRQADTQKSIDRSSQKKNVNVVTRTVVVCRAKNIKLARFHLAGYERSSETSAAQLLSNFRLNDLREILTFRFT